MSRLLIPTTKTVHPPSHFLNSALSGTKHINWSKIVREEVTVDRDVPLPDDIYNFTEVSQILIALMLWGSKSEYRIQSQAKRILPTSVVWCWHSVAVICLSGRWQRWEHQTEEPYQSSGCHSGEELCRARRRPRAFTSDIASRAPATSVQSHIKLPLHIIRNRWGEDGGLQQMVVVVFARLPLAHLISA